MGGTDSHHAIETVWRMESARVIATLTRIVRDVALAEDLAHDALVAALQQWPTSGIPRNPGAWLVGAAKHRAIDAWRRKALLERKHEEIGRELAASTPPDAESLLEEDEIGDDLLRLMFVACHPILSADARVALTLRLLGGLTTEEIARAFLVPETTISQRIVRAKRTLAAKKVPFEVPRGPELTARLTAVLEAIYLVFNEGYAATAGENLLRPELTAEALRLGRMLAELMPAEPEVHGLVALMELQSSRLGARTAADGTPVLLLDQNRSRWDRLLIGRGLAALNRAARLGGASGFHTLQARIAACHARATSADATDWKEIASLYGQLAAIAPSPVVELNRGVAVAMAYGAAAGLAIVDAIRADPLLQQYHLLPAVRGDLLARLERGAEARAEFERAAELTRNARERELFLARARALS